MDEAVALLIRRLVERTGTKPDEIGDVVIGCALQGGENWQFGGRQAVMLAGLPVNVPAVAVDRQCASSMSAVAMGAFEVMLGNSRVVLTGGMEHMTHVPIGTPFLSKNDRLLTEPEYAKYKMDVGFSMGLTAEKLAAESGITRDEMDLFALESHRRASEAIEAGWFRGEITEVKALVGGEERIISVDQSVRKDTTIEQLRGLRPAFKEGGLITAGNSSPLNAGAAMVELASEEEVKERGWTPLAKILSFGWAGVEPSLMGKGPVPASKKALASAGVGLDAVDLWEVNEAFAVVNLYAIRELGLERDRMNVHGGAISLGHPLGASGARLVGTLARQLRETGKEYGVAALCVGGGQGFATVLQRA
jgi:acetyl-CoA C-acetyltransferase